MPDTTIVQNQAIIWDRVTTFPYTRYEDTHPISPGNPFYRELINVGPILRENGYVNAAQGRTNNAAGAGYAFRADAGGPTYLQLESAAAGSMIIGLDSMRLTCDVGTGFALADGAQRTSARRVWWLSWLMQSPDAAPDLRNGLIVTPANNGGVTRWIDNAATHGGFGISGDGAGQWRYTSYNRAGPGVLREALALPAHTLAEWNLFELVVIGERFGIPATMDLWFNGTFVANRNWTGALLEPYTANEWYMLPLMGGGSVGAGGGHCNITDVTCRQGRFTRDGVEV